MRVREILMTKGAVVHTVHPNQTVREAARLMTEHNVGAVMVTDDRKQVVGILSERDIVREAVHSPTPLFDYKVHQIMTTKLIVATPDDELAYVVDAMVEKNIRHLPVMEDDELVGILSIRDVVKAIRAKYEGEIHHLRYYLADEH